MREIVQESTMQRGREAETKSKTKCFTAEALRTLRKAGEKRKIDPGRRARRKE
jgi:hypothetical protein